MKQDNINKFTEDTLNTLSRIKQTRDSENISRATIVEKKLNSLFSGLETLRANNSLLTIGIVGQMKVGKSSFLNALLFDGEAILPKAATPMTAGLTVIEKSPEEGKSFLEVEYYTKKEWDSISKTAEDVERIRTEILRENPVLVNDEKKLDAILKIKVGEVDFASYEIVKKKLTPIAKSRIGHDKERVVLNTGAGLAKSLDEYVGAHGSFTSVVKALHIYLDNDNIDGLRIVDTPGVNDPVVTRDAKTTEFLREAHGVLMVMTADSVLTGSDIDFLNNRIGKEGIASVVMVVNKIDMACCSGKYRNGYRLENAFEEICATLAGHIDQKKILFNHPSNIKGIVFTSGVADSLSQKLPDHPEKVDSDEQKALDNLRKIYPIDFNEENIIESLQLLSSQNQTLFNDYIQDEFIRKKDDIIDEKLSSFIAEHKKDVIQTLDSVIDEIKTEISFLEKESLDSLKSQMEMLSGILKKLLPKIRDEIKGFVKTLEAEVKKAFQLKLVNKQPQISEIPTDVKSIKYTREGTKLGLSKSGVLNISLLNSAELCRLENPQVDRLRIEIHNFWNDLFVNERTKLVNFILDEITKMSQNVAAANVDDSQIRILVNKLVKTELNGLETLELLQTCETFKATFKETLSASSFTDINTTFGEIEQSKAEERINKESAYNLSEALSQAKSLNDDLFSSLKDKCDQQCHVVRDIMESFSAQFDCLMRNEIESHQKQMERKISSKEISLTSAKDVLSDFEEIKKAFKAL